MPRVGSHLEIACFRVAQEALTNVTRHARAQQVWVELTQHAAELHLIVRDDGCGFDPATLLSGTVKDLHLGLVGMEERVTLVGGRLSINSTPGQGTEIHAIFPLDASVQDKIT